MSETVPRGQEAAERAAAETTVEPHESRGRGRWVALVVVVVVVVVVAAGAVSAWRAAVSSPASTPAGAGQSAPPPATAQVARKDISAVTPVTATLGYARSYKVTGQGGGTLTWLPAPGQVIRQGQELYRVDNGSPVVLLYGSVPAWRTLTEGITGQDVAQLNHDLVTLGYADEADIAVAGWDYYSWETAYAVQLLEEHLGVIDPPGILSLGQVVFQPEALRVSQTASLGARASGTVLTATSDRLVVTVPLSTSRESEVAPGDRVTVTLPDGTTTPGRVASVGSVASGSAGNATVTVTVTLSRPSAAGTWDQAPVTVNVTSATALHALVVPVAALLAQSSGGYAVEVVGTGNTRRYVPVQPGIFDDADGMVQVTGALAPGERVVVPAS